jgi:hypothetical protein
VLRVWHDAPAAALDVFAAANAAMWREIADHALSAVWKTSMARSAAPWAHHRAVRHTRSR